MKRSFLSPSPLPTGRQAPLPLEGEGEGGGLSKLQFLKGRKAGTKFLLDAFAGTKIKIFSAGWTKPFTILLTERFERDLQKNLFTSDL
jgi:hypothetical protein